MVTVDLIPTKEDISQLFPFNDRDGAGEWLVQEEQSREYPAEQRRVISMIELPDGGAVELLDISQPDAGPNVMVVHKCPRISRGRSPLGTFMSPLELFLAFDPGAAPPEILQRNHAILARSGTLSPQPRLFDPPLWGIPDPDLPPTYGAVDLCEGSFFTNWSQYSMWHGVNNQSGAFILWTGWSVVTGISVPRSAALCMADSSNNAGAQARYVISNRQSGGPWVDIWNSGWTGPGEGAGYQVYGPNPGQTRILLETQNNAQQIFFAGASWGVPQDWLSP